MAIGIQGVSQWQTWRKNVGWNDDVSTFMDAASANPSDFWDSSTLKFKTPYANRIISVHPFTGIAVQGWADVTGDEGFTFDIWGCMFPNHQGGPGPMQKIFRQTGTLDNSEGWATADSPAPGWDSAEYTGMAMPAGSLHIASEGSAVAFGGNVGPTVDESNNSVLLLSTLGYSHLLLQVSADSVAWVKGGFLWKGISKEGVI